MNEHARDGSTAILWAAYHSNLEMARALIAAGAAVNTPNHYGITPLLQASRSGDAPLVAALLKAGADPAATPSRRRDAAHGRVAHRARRRRAAAARGGRERERRRRLPAADRADVGGGGRPRGRRQGAARGGRGSESQGATSPPWRNGSTPTIRPAASPRSCLRCATGTKRSRGRSSRAGPIRT